MLFLYSYFLHRITVLLLLAGWLLITSCALPDAAATSSISLEKPTLAVVNNKTELTLTIQGNYSSATFPKFDGFNIYVGDNNDPASITKRILYIDNDNELPSIRINNSQNNSTSFSTKIISQFKYRFTSTATQQDLDDAKVVDRSVLQNRSYRNYERFNFFVKPVNNGVEGPSSDVASHSITRFEENLEVNWNQTINTIPSLINDSDFDFASISFNSNTTPPLITLPSTSGANLGISPGGQANNIYDTLFFPDDVGNYSEQNLTPYVSNRYYFAQLNSTIDYLAIYINNINTTNITFSIAHEKENTLTDFNK